MGTPINSDQRNILELPLQDVELDLTDDKEYTSIRSGRHIIQQDAQRGLLKEINAGKIALLLISAVAALAILITLTTAYITITKSSAEAKAFVELDVTVLEAITKLVYATIGPLLLYYFMQEHRNKR